MRILWGLAVAGLVVRLLYAWPIQERPFSDMLNDETMAVNLLGGRGLALDNGFVAYRAPGYPLFLAGLYRIAGYRSGDAAPFYPFVRGTQCVMGAVVVMLVGWVAFRLACRPAAILAAGLAAFSRDLIFWTPKLSTEALYTGLAVATVAALVAWHEKRGAVWLVAAGVAAGLAGLTRPVFYAFVPFAAGWVWKQTKVGDPPLRTGGRPYVATGVFLLAAGLMVMPWGVRNLLVLGTPRITPTNAGHSLHVANNPDVRIGGPGMDLKYEILRERLTNEGLGEVEQDLWYRTRTREWIVENPARYAALAAGRLWYMLARDVFPLTRVPFDRMEFLGGIRLPLVPWGVWAAPFVLVGLRIAIRSAGAWTPVNLFLAASLLAHALTASEPRYRAPLVPWLALLAGTGASALARGAVAVARARLGRG